MLTDGSRPWSKSLIVVKVMILMKSHFEFSSSGARRCESMSSECTLITPYRLGSRLANAPNDFGFESCFDQEVFLLDFFSYASIALVHNVRIAM